MQLAIQFLPQAGDNLDLAWKNGTVQHKGFIPLEWLKQHHYPAQNEPIKEKPEYKSGIPKITKVRPAD